MSQGLLARIVVSTITSKTTFYAKFVVILKVFRVVQELVGLLTTVIIFQRISRTNTLFHILRLSRNFEAECLGKFILTFSPETRKLWTASVDQKKNRSGSASKHKHNGEAIMIHAKEIYRATTNYVLRIYTTLNTAQSPPPPPLLMQLILNKLAELSRGEYLAFTEFRAQTVAENK